MPRPNRKLGGTPLLTWPIEVGRKLVTGASSFFASNRSRGDYDLVPLIMEDHEEGPRDLEGLEWPAREGKAYGKAGQSSATRRALVQVLISAAAALLFLFLLLLLSLSSWRPAPHVPPGGGGPKSNPSGPGAGGSSSSSSPRTNGTTTTSCSLLQSKPRLGPPRALSVAAAARGSSAQPVPPLLLLLLTKLAGYIRVYDPEYLYMHEGGYLPLDFKEAEFSTDYNSLSLRDACAGVTVNLVHDETRNLVHLRNLNWHFRVTTKFDHDGRAPNKRSYVYCSINEPELAGAFRPDLWRYSCRRPQTFQCQKLDDEGTLHSVAELVLESFELELGGEARATKEGRFSKPRPRPKDSCAARRGFET